MLKGDFTTLPEDPVGSDCADESPGNTRALMKSTMGRPRRTTDEQVETILKWHAEYRAWRAGRPAISTIRELARYLGLSRGAVTDVIRRAGAYKQASPENRVSVQRVRDRIMRQIRRQQRY